MGKIRVDALLVQRGMVESRARAQRLVMAGQVRADGQRVPKPATLVRADAELVIEQPAPYVSRGGEKLAAAISAFSLDVRGAVCADVGASTGGFTDCLLQHGAARVYTIDVGHGILHWKLRQDERVVVMEKTNARSLDALPEMVDWVTMDASFISVKTLLPVAAKWLKSLGQMVVLVKPQFEVGRREAARGKGVVRDPELHRAVLRDVLAFAQENHLTPKGLIRSPLQGPKGNIEFLVWMDRSGGQPEDIDAWIEREV